jgi:hypothetical protein
LDITLSNQNYTVTFNVTDGTNAIEGATIAVDGQTLTTDANGHATIDLANGDYTAVISKTGYNPYTKTFTVNGSDLTLDITLSNQNYTVTFNVTDGSNPLEGVGVSVNGNDLTTDADGKVSIDLPNGDYSADFKKTGYKDKTVNFELNGSDLSVPVELEKTTTSISEVQSMVKIYPNPANDYLVIESKVENGKAQIYSVEGNLIKEVDISGNTRIKVSSLPSGVYLIKVQGGEEEIIGRFIKK